MDYSETEIENMARALLRTRGARLGIPPEDAVPPRIWEDAKDDAKAVLRELDDLRKKEPAQRKPSGR